MLYVTTRMLLPLVVIGVFLIAHVQAACFVNPGRLAYKQVSGSGGRICYAVVPVGQSCSGCLYTYETMLDSTNFGSLHRPAQHVCGINREELTSAEKDCYYLNYWYLDTDRVTYYRVTSCERRQCGQQTRLRPRYGPIPIDIRRPTDPPRRSFPPIGLPTEGSTLYRRKRQLQFLEPGSFQGFFQLLPCRQVPATEDNVVCDSQVTQTLTAEARQVLRARVQKDIQSGNVRQSYNLTDPASARPGQGTTCFQLYSGSSSRYCL